VEEQGGRGKSLSPALWTKTEHPAGPLRQARLSWLTRTDLCVLVKKRKKKLFFGSRNQVRDIPVI